MPTIVYQTNPKTGVKYAYLSTSYWDKDKKAPRSTREYLGRVDPETGDIIKGSGRNRKVITVPGDTSVREKEKEALDLRDASAREQEKEARDPRDAEIASLKARLAEMTSRYEEAVRILHEIRALAGTLD